MPDSTFRSILTICLSFLFLLPLINGQSESEARVEKAFSAIKALKEGTLIIRLPSKANKISELNKILASKTLDANERKRTKKILHSTIVDRDNYNREFIHSFDTLYKFSDFLFMYDTSTVALKDGQHEGIFLNNQMKVDKSINLKKGPYFILRSGSTDRSNTSGIEALVIMDEQLNDLEKPFPYYVKQMNFGTMLASIFSSKSKWYIGSEKAIGKLNQNLFRFYHQTNIGYISN